MKSETLHEALGILSTSQPELVAALATVASALQIPRSKLQSQEVLLWDRTSKGTEAYPWLGEALRKLDTNSIASIEAFLSEVAKHTAGGDAK